MALAAVAACLVLPASASAALKTYAGTTDVGGNVAIDVKVGKTGLPKGIVELRGSQLPTSCELSGQITSRLSIPTVLPLSPRFKFYGEFAQPTYGNVSWIRGKFTSKRQIVGSFVYDHHYLAEGSFPEENCTTGVQTFTVVKGAPDLVTPSTSKRLP